jgi:hypothetical protein
MLVTRAEEWWIEAESLEDAEALLVAGRGYRATPGELIHAEVDVVTKRREAEAVSKKSPAGPDGASLPRTVSTGVGGVRNRPSE